MVDFGGVKPTMSTWSLFIKDDIKERIGTGEPLPCKLTLQSLAKHYKVSLTPVRQAAAKLIEEGYLHKQSNARLSINNKKTGSWRKSAVRRRAAPPKDHFEEIRENVILVCLKGEPVSCGKRTRPPDTGSAAPRFVRFSAGSPVRA